MPQPYEDLVSAVVADRQASYGHPFDDFSRTSDMLTALGFRVERPGGELRSITPNDIPMVMWCVKMSREMHSHHPDNLLDIKGYALCLEKVKARQAELTAG